MKKMNLFLYVALIVMIVLVATSCAKSNDAPQAPAAAAPAAPVSDGSQDLKISYRMNVAEADADNYFSFTGNIRYMAVDKDHADATTGASVLGSTHLFNAYLYDVEGKATLSSGLRGLFLFGVNPYSQIETDNLNAYKTNDGKVVVQYAHRGTAYRITSDSNGKLQFPEGSFEMRPIGYIASGSPQVISKDFSADGTAATIDWTKVWDSKIAGGKAIEGNDKAKTGSIMKNIAAADAQYFFDGALDIALENDVLTIQGALTAVHR